MKAPRYTCYLRQIKKYFGWGGSILAAYRCRSVVLQGMGVSLEKCSVRRGHNGLFLLHDGKVLMEQQ